MTKHKILIVEDERIVAKDIKGSLRNFGYEVIDIVVTGEDAIQVSSEQNPDLVLMDIMLKGELNGIDAARHIRDNMRIPVVFLTAYADESTLQNAKLTEPFGYIIKPFEDAELHSTIQMAIYRFEMERKLIEREQRLTTILKSISDAVIVTDKDGTITYANPVTEALTGWSIEDIYGKNLFEIYRIIDDKGDGLANEMLSDTLKKDMSIFRGNQLLISRTEEIIPVDTILTNLVDDDNETNGSVVVLRDITQRLESEAKSRESFDKLRMALGGIIQAMTFTVEKRDPYTAGHQKRVSDLARAIAFEMDLDEDRVDGIRLAGVVHDVGKIAIPSEILSKPGKLSDLELNLIRKHPEVGYDILKNIEFPWPIADMVIQHHERLDGSGYPNGLKEEDILLESKILAVADVVEAMSSHRPYRPALGVEKALAEIAHGSGTIYDHNVVTACTTLFKKKQYQFR